MSPLWRDEVGIFIGPRRIVLNRMSRGLRPACVADYASLVEAPHWLRRVAGRHDGSLEWLEPAPGEAGTLEKLAQLAEMHA